MVHSAYDAIELVNNSPSKIESVASYNSNLLLGCSDCSLRIYSPPPSSSADADVISDGEIKREPYVLQRTMASFWRKPPLAMEVCRSRDLLLSLSEWIALHRLPNLEIVVAIGKTKGANVYSWDDRRGFLCVGRQKRLAIYRLDGNFTYV